MDQFNWLVTELLVEQRARQLASQPPHMPPEEPGHNGLRRTLATAIVRLGLRLDPKAGEPLAKGFAYAREGRR
jgi:hypothetical protein